MMPLAFWGLGATELVIIAGVLVLLFGASRVPKLARSLGQSVLELRRGLREVNRGELDYTEDNEDA